MHQTDLICTWSKGTWYHTNHRWSDLRPKAHCRELIQSLCLPDHQIMSINSFLSYCIYLMIELWLHQVTLNFTSSKKKRGTFFLKGVGVFDFDYLSQALLQLIFLSSSWLWFNIYSMVRSGVCYMWITTQDRGAVMTYCFLQTLYFELIQVFIICHPWFVCVSLQISSEKIFIYILFELEVRFLIVNMTH